ncbi:MAG: TolC family protein [Clostridiales bacterium]|nr:TolC family protein [Clostridiales bacterium]
MKKILIITVISVLALTASVGFSSDLYNFDVLNEMAMANDLQIKINELTITQNELELEDALWESRFFGVKTPDPEKSYSNMVIRDVNPINAETALMNSEKEYDNYIENISSDLDILLMDWKLMGMQIENLENQLVYQELVYNNDIKENELGLMSDYQLDASLMTLNNMKLDHENLLIDQANLFRNIEAFVGQDLDMEKGIEFTVEAENYGALLDYETALANDMTVYEKLKDVETSQIMYNYAVKLFQFDDLNLSKSMYDLEIAKLNYENAVNNFNISYHNDFDNLSYLKEKYDLAVDSYNLYKESYNISSEKYARGLISYETLLSEEIKLKNSEYNMMSAMVGYNKAVLGFESNY